MKISMFSTHEMKYIWYLLEKEHFLFILYFLEDLQLINLLTIKTYRLKEIYSASKCETSDVISDVILC